MDFKAQSSIEYLAIVGLGLLMATPFIGLVQQDVISLRTDSQDARFTSSLDEMESAIERADALGASAQTSFVLSVPDNIQSARVVGNKNIVFTQNRSGELTNYTRIFENNVSATELPTERGRYRINAKTSGDQVVLEWDTFAANFEALNPIIVGNEITFEDQSQASRKSIVNREWIVNGTVNQTGSETFSYTFSDTQVYNITLEIEADDGEIDQVSKLYQAEQSEILAFSINSQIEWNQGFFNRTSADRNDNSGNLGLGYLNGTNPSSTNLEEGLVGYWRFDDTSGSTALDYSSIENDGTINGASLEQGIFDTSSLYFSGSDDVTVNGPLAPDGSSEFTVSTWIKSDNTGVDASILGTTTGDSTDSNLGLRYDASGYDGGGSNLIKFGVETDQGSVSGETESDIQSSEWQHVLMRWSSTSAPEVFINGEEVSYTSDPGSLSGNLEVPDFYIGKGLKDPDGFWEGNIDEVKFYNRSLTDSEIKQLYLQGEPFKGNYTSKAIENADTQNWKRLEIQASINSTAEELTATFETLKDSLLYTAEQAYNSATEWNQGDFNKTTSDEVITEYNYPSEFEASTQSGFNQGEFNGTSADRKDNSGDLGLGYRNGSTGGNLVGYWRMDGDSAKDYSGNVYDGSFSGGVTTGDSGVFSTPGFSFDGEDDLVQLPSLDQYSSFSACAWVRYDNLGSEFDSNEWNSPFDTLGDAGSHQFSWESSSAGSSEITLKTPDGTASFGDFSGLVGKRVLMCGAYDGSTYSTYLNGSHQNSISGSSNIDLSNGARIGGRGSSDVQFNGSIDEFRMYNKALSESEIKELYFNGRPFQGNYTAEKIDNSEETNWDDLEVNASIPSDTSVNATFKALDTNGNLVDSQSIDLSEGLNNYSLSVSSSEDAEVFINGTSSNVTKSWEIHGLEVFSSEVEDKNEGLRIGYRNGSSSDNLVGYWRMDENVAGDGGTIKDYSGNDIDGLAYGGLSTENQGVMGSRSFDFDGSDDYINISNTQNTGDSGSIILWVNTDSTDEQLPFFHRTDGEDDRLYMWMDDGDHIDFGLGASTKADLDDIFSFNPSDGWTFYALRWDSGNWKAWKDTQTSTGSYSGTVNINRGLNIGHRATTGGRHFDGQIDELQLYNSSLSEEKINQLYFNGRPFQGNYTAEKIDNSQETSWEKAEINASVPSETGLTAEFEALDSSDELVDREYLSIDSGENEKNYTLDVQASENARLSFNGTSSNATKTWNVHNYRVYSGEREVDQSQSFDVQDGSNEFSLGVSDSKDARIRLNGTTSDVTQSWTVSNMSVFTE
ncbi:MAG: LamG domain-containing protein [Candidatus Nanohaloarchaea archaeon]